MKKALFILNPDSGTQNFWSEVESVIGCLSLNQIVSQSDVVYTEKKYDARAVAERLKYGQYDVVVAVGGDGTVSDVINGIIKSKCRIPVAVFPVGTTNGFAHALDLPFQKEEFCCMLRDFNLMDIDVGKVNDHYFVSTIGGGLGADVSYKAASATKAMFGKKAYFYEALRTFPKKIFRSMKIYYDSDEFTAKTDTVLFYISNAGGIAGNKNLFRNSTMNDGVLNVVVFQRMSVWQFSSLFWRFLRGKPIDHPKMRCFSTKKIRIRAIDDKKIPVSSDGEMAGHLPITVECVPKAVKIVVPKNNSDKKKNPGF